MKIQVISGTSDEVAAGIESCDGADFVSVHCDCSEKIAPVQAALPKASLHGATSCLGAMTHNATPTPVAAFVLTDSEGDYGTALRSIAVDPRAAARDATQAALRDADRAGEVPDLVWVSSAPGTEEEILEGIQSVVGLEVPVIGGSAADNTVEGNWFVFDAETTAADGVIVSVLFPSGSVSFAYQNGYVPTEHKGVVTSVEGRVLRKIDGRPALDVYREWTNETFSVPTDVADTAPILSESTLHPFGREAARFGSVPYFLLAHPAGARANGEIDLFASVVEGEVLTQMSGTIESLTKRAGRVAQLALTAGQLDAADVKGALMIYCGGCMLTVKDQLDQVSSGVNEALGGAPFLGAFTFGEQGAILGAGNRHGNLMISCIVFS